MATRGCTNCSCGTRPSDGTDEGPSPEDIEAFGDVTRPCPNCKADLYDDVAVCWKCGHAVSEASSSTAPPVWVVVVTVILLAVIVLFWIR